MRSANALRASRRAGLRAATLGGLIAAFLASHAAGAGAAPAFVAGAASPAPPATAQEPRGGEPAPDTAAAPADTIPPPGGIRVLRPLRVEVRRLGANEATGGALPLAVQTLPGESSPPTGRELLTGRVAALPGITTPDQFGSPFQQGLRVRGFTVSPVVGVPQSVSVFVDGVRVNEPDASQVNFDLVPLHAAEEVVLVRGPGGPFGKNTLAGALLIRTKRGGPQPHAALDVSGGYFGATGGVEEWALEGEAGGELGGFDLFGAVRHVRTDGWRRLNAARLLNAFVKVGRRHEGGDAWLSYTFAHDSIEAPGSLPRSWLEGGRLPAELSGFAGDRRRLQYTGGRGDYFQPTLHFLNGFFDHRLGRDWRLTANAFGRFGEYEQFNDNLTEPNSLGRTSVASAGGTVQVSHTPSARLALAGGIEYAHHDVDIDIFALPGGAFPDIAVDLTERVGTAEDDVGAFLTAGWTPDPRLGISGSLRYDWIRLPFRDELDPAGSGVNTFRRLTGSLGATYGVGAATELFGSFGRGFRAPFILEITCSDEDDPCPLPFELGADPPIDPVVVDSWQVGVRSAPAPDLYAEAAAYWAEVHDDILFVTNAAGASGFFRNVERTRRQGVEAQLRWRILPPLETYASFAWTRATFQSEARLATGFLEADEEDEDEGAGAAAAPPIVQPGDPFPVVPRVAFAVGARLAADEWTFSAEGRFTGERFLVSDETGSGRFGTLAPYFLLDAGASHRVGDFELYVQAQNVLDAAYAPFGIVARNIRGPGEGRIEAFLTPGEPFRLFAGVRAVWR